MKLYLRRTACTLCNAIQLAYYGTAFFLLFLRKPAHRLYNKFIQSTQLSQRGYALPKRKEWPVEELSSPEGLNLK